MARPAAQFDGALPRFINGTRVHEHPWLWHLKKYVAKGHTFAEVADVIGVRPQTLHVWKKRAEADRRFKLPADRAAQFAGLFGVPLKHIYIEE